MSLSRRDLIRVVAAGSIPAVGRRHVTTGTAEADRPGRVGYGAATTAAAQFGASTAGLREDANGTTVTTGDDGETDSAGYGTATYGSPGV